MPSLNRLCQIPIYRLLLRPESYLLENNPDVTIITLLNNLNNHDNTNHLIKLRHKTEDYCVIYYNSVLLIEAKLFCNTLLRNTHLYDDKYKQLLNYNSIDSIFEILIANHLTFFKFLIMMDVDKFKLNKGWFKRDFQYANNIEEALSVLRGYQIVSKIINKNLEELRLLRY